jgi:hypothetical protein
VCAVICEPVSPCNSLLTGKLTGNFAILGPKKPISLHETTVLQRLFTKFPTQINRENILKNREFLSCNTEFHCKVRKRPFLSHACSSDSDRLTPRRVNGVDIDAQEVDLDVAGC